MRWASPNRYLLLLLFNVLNVAAFGAIVAVAVINVVDRAAPTNLLIYYGYTGLLSLVLLLSELRVPRLLHSQARFLFTYTGRGIVLTYFGCITYSDRTFNVFACIYAVSLGVVYFVVAWVPFVSTQHGLAYNWSRWVQEGSSHRHGNAGPGGDADPSDDTACQGARGDRPGHGWSPEKPTFAIDVQSTGCYPDHPMQPAAVSPPAQAAGWPAPTASEAAAQGSTRPAAATAAGHESNGSFVYGLTVKAPPLEGTAFSRATDSCTVPTSPPLPYHVFAPASREPLARNIAQTKRAPAE